MKRVVIVVVILVSLLFAGTARGLDVYSSLQGIRQALAWRGGAFMMRNAEVGMTLFAWPAKGGTWGFAGLTDAGDPINNLLRYINATATDLESMASFTKGMEERGWEYVTSEALPAAMVARLQSIPVYLMSIGARALVTPLLVPLILPAGQFEFPTPVSAPQVGG